MDVLRTCQCSQSVATDGQQHSMCAREPLPAYLRRVPADTAGCRRERSIGWDSNRSVCSIESTAKLSWRQRTNHFGDLCSNWVSNSRKRPLFGAVSEHLFRGTFSQAKAMSFRRNIPKHSPVRTSVGFWLVIGSVDTGALAHASTM